MTALSNERITKSTPEKSLLAPLNKKVAAAIQAVSLPVIKAVVLNRSTESSTSRETRITFQQL
mgnify:CR=1 FL=1